MKEVKFYRSLRKTIKLILPLSFFVGTGAYMVQKGSPIGWAFIAIFVVGCLIMFSELFDRRPRLILNEAGICGRATDREWIPWEQVDFVYLRKDDTYGSTEFICIKLNDDERLQDKRKLPKNMRKQQKTISPREFSINMSALKIDAEYLTHIIYSMAKVDDMQEKARLLRELQRRL